VSNKRRTRKRGNGIDEKEHPAVSELKWMMSRLQKKVGVKTRPLYWKTPQMSTTKTRTIVRSWILWMGLLSCWHKHTKPTLYQWLNHCVEHTTHRLLIVKEWNSSSLVAKSKRESITDAVCACVFHEDRCAVWFKGWVKYESPRDSYMDPFEVLIGIASASVINPCFHFNVDQSLEQ